ncbi:MAG TPA: sugar ABC transporter substrate-binding protein [Anaerolineae bacterium]|nr:sugar ABC transporter substrate-binding protein [Anaerolineae bacterium]
MFKKTLYLLLVLAIAASLFACTTETPVAEKAAQAEPESAEEEAAEEVVAEEVVTVASGDVFTVSLGWQENESGQRFTQGYDAAFKELGWEYLISNANYDPKLQSEQIDAFIKMKPKAMFLTCSDPAGIRQAVNRAIDEGIPVFTADCYIAGTLSVSQIASNNYGMGVYTMSYIMEALGGKGKVGMIGLPNNETWDLRELGARYVLRNYPDIEIVYWPYDATGAVTPRQAIENMLTANADMDAIWCSWDGAAMEGALAAEEAGRPEIIFTGIDGGERAFEQIQMGGPFKLTMAQSIYWMSYMDVMYAKEYFAGNTAPRFVVSPVYAVDKAVLDAVSAGLDANEYDIPGKEVDLGWKPAL